MVKEIIFHLGDCKTGTTSIQSVLAARAWDSQVGDIVYPARVNHIPLAKTLAQPREMPKQDKQFTKVRKAFDDSDAAFGVISAEHFEFVDPQLVKTAIAQHLPDYADRIRLIAYVRPHGERLLSTFAERSKKGLFLRPLGALHDKLLRNRLLFYAPRFEKWRALFGDQFSLRPFVRDQLYKGDVVEDFFCYLFGSENFAITRDGGRNQSLTVEDIAMMRHIHGHLSDLSGNKLQHLQQALGWYMADLLGTVPYPGGGTKPQLHKALAGRVVKAYREDAIALDQMFFDGSPMQDALEAIPDRALGKAQSFLAKTHFDAPALRQFEVWARFLHRMMVADPAHFAWAVRRPEQRSKKPPNPGDQ